MGRPEGNVCLLFLMRISTFGLLLVSLMLIGIGGYLISTMNGVSAVPMIFIVLGVVEFLFCLIGFYSKNSRVRLVCFLWVLGFLCFGQMVLAIVGYAERNAIISWAGSHHSSNAESAESFEKVVNDDINVALLLAFVAAVVQVACFLFTWFYVCSIRKLTGSHAKGLMRDADGDLDFGVIIAARTAKKQDEVKTKYDEKRQQFQEMLKNANGGNTQT